MIVDESGYALLGERGDESNDRETEANAFADALLMPAAWIHQALRSVHAVDLADDAAARQLAERLGVSVQAMTYRLLNLGLVRNL